MRTLRWLLVDDDDGYDSGEPKQFFTPFATSRDAGDYVKSLPAAWRPGKKKGLRPPAFCIC
jgi:hypothetical protein